MTLVQRDLNLVLLFLWTMFGCRQEIDLGPVPPNPLVEIKEFTRVSDGTAVPQDILTKVGEGFYAQLILAPKKDRPMSFKDREVADPRLWACCVICFPRGENSSSRNAIRFAIYSHLKAPNRHLVYPAVGSSGRHWKPPGYKGTLAAPKEILKDQLPYWTYMGAPFDTPGDYIYEIQIFPTYKRISTARSSRGDPVILRRGNLRIEP